MEKIFTFIKVSMCLIAIAAPKLFSQAVGDYGSKATGNWGTAGTNWIVCTSAGTWAGATDPAPGAPSSTTNVWIRAGHTVTVEASSKNCNNLTIESGSPGGSLVSTANNQNPVYVKLYGTLTNNGSMGGSNDGLSIQPNGTTSNTLTGSGSTYYICRLQPNVASASITFDANITICYTGSTGTGGSAVYSNSKDGLTFTINSGKTLTLGNLANFTIGTSTTTDAAFTVTLNINGTLTLNSNGNGGVLSLRSSAGKTSTINVGSSGTLNCGNNFFLNGAGTHALNVASGGTVNINSVSKSVDLTPATATLNGTFDLNSASTSTRHLGNATVTSSGTLRLKDGTYPSGTITLNTGSTVEYYGSGSYTIPASPTTYSNLKINNSSGLTLGATTTVNGTLTLASGNVSTGSNSLNISSTGSVSRTSGHINGNFNKYVSTGSPSLTFEIGDASNYTPVVVATSNVTVAGNLTAKSTGGNHSDILNSGINSSKCVSRYWTLTNSGITLDNYNATFNFVSGDVIGSADYSAFIAKKYNGSWSSLTVGTKTATSTEVTGVTSFSDFAIGEAASSDPTLSITGTLTNFGLVATGSYSSEQNYSVGGVNLTGDITITPPTGFEISLGTGGGFSATNPITLSPSGGTVTSTTIYVRFAPGTTGSFSDSIAHTSTGALTQKQAVAGTGLAAQPTTQASNVTFSDVLANSMTVNWTVGNGSNHLVIARAGSAIATNPTDGSTYSANAAYGSGTPIGSGFVVYNGTSNSVNVTGLTEGSAYYFAVFEFNGSAGTENYLTSSPATGACGANAVVSTGSGNWSSGSSWVGGIVPTSSDNVRISSSSTITIDDNNASCKNLSFASTSSAKIAMSTSGVLNIYGDFSYPSTTSTCFSSWSSGGKVRFAGSATTQLISNVNISTSTIYQCMPDIQVDKPSGKVTTAATDCRLNVANSLEILSGTFELASTDDLQGIGFDLATPTQPTITVQNPGNFDMAGGASHIRSGNSGTSQLGNIIVSGTFNVKTSSTNGVAMGTIDVENGGTVTVNSGWGASNLFNCNAVTIKSGGTWNNLSTSNYWGASATLTLNSGGLFQSTGSTNTYFPASFTNNGTVRYYRSISTDQVITDINYNNLQISNGGQNKTWTLGADRTISGNLILDGGSSLILSSAGSQSVNLNGSLTLTSGTVTLGANNFVLGASSTVSGTPSATNMIVSEGTGELRKIFTGNNSFTFPVGDNTVTPEYSPVAFSLNSNGGLSSAYVGVKLKNSKHINIGGFTNYLNRYWSVSQSGITSPNYTASFTYTDADVVGTENTLYGGKNSGEMNIWTGLGGVDVDNNRFSATGLTTFSDFSAMEIGALPVELTTFVSSANGRNILLEWATATEVNSSKFVIERSEDGQNWMRVGDVQASGYSNAPRTYAFTDKNLMTAKYSYRLKIIDNDGTYEYSQVINAEVGVPAEFALSQNYPNPFNPSTKIDYQLPVDADVQFILYSVNGEIAARLFSQGQQAGYHAITLDAAKFNLASGMYILRMQAAGSAGVKYNAAKKVVLTK